MPASIGALAKLAVDPALPFDASSLPLEFISESLRAEKTIIDTAGIRGTRSHSAERTRAGTYTVSGSITLNPSPNELNDLLQYIMGGTPTVGTPVGKTTFPLGESILPLQVMVDRVAKVFTYTDCKIVRATFRGSEGNPLEVTLDLEGLTETVGNAGTFPALTLRTDAPFVYMDATITLLSVVRQAKEVEIVIENTAATDRFLNSVTRTEIPITDRMVTLRMSVPYEAANTDLYNQALLGDAADVTFTNGTVSLQFSFLGKVQFPATSPTVGGKGELMLELTGTARKFGVNNELSVILDLTA